MKKVITLAALIVGIMIVTAPVASAVLTQDEASIIRASANNVKLDLTNLGNNYQTYILTLNKIALELNVLSAQLNQGLISYDQAGSKLVDISAEVTTAVVLKNNIEFALMDITTKVRAIMVNLTIYQNS